MWTMREEAVLICGLFRREMEDFYFVTLMNLGKILGSEYHDSRSCGLEGHFDFTYQMKGMGKQCMGNTSEVWAKKSSIDFQMDNCGARNEINFHFRQCSFPDFGKVYFYWRKSLDQTFICLGAWNGLGPEKYIVVLNEETQEYKCGVRVLYPLDDRFS